MAAQNRRRNDTSRHAVGVWEEFSFLDKGSSNLGEGREFRLFFLSQSGSWVGFAPAVCSLSRTAIKSFGEVLDIPEKRKCFLFPSESPKASWKIEEQRSTRHLFVPTTASGTQGEKPLVDGKKFVREVGKLELYLWKKIWLNRFSKEGKGEGDPVRAGFSFFSPS